MDELFDQRTPFGRFALAHVLLTAGDTLLTISLAGSLFFSISPQAAKGKVLLYLLITVAPFSVVAPVLGPIIDRSQGARRTMVVLSAVLRAAIAVVMAGDLNSLLLFPEAFAMLVLSKLYLVTKGALVPLLVEQSLLHEAGQEGSSGHPGPDPSGPVARFVQTDRLPADQLTPPFGVPTVDHVTGAEDPGKSHLGVSGQAGSFGGQGGGEVLDSGVHARSPGRRSHRASGNRTSGSSADLATINARLGLLAALAGFAASIPAIVVLKIGGAPWVLRLDILVFLAATVAGMRLPVRRLGARHPRTAIRMDQGSGVSERVGASARTTGPAGPGNGVRDRPKRPIDAFGLRAVTHAEVTLALTAMSVLKVLVGFLTFLLAFDLRRMHAATWWFGLALGASVAGSVVGVILVPRIRRRFTEQQVLAVSLWLIAMAATITVSIGGLGMQASLAFVIGLSAAAAKPGFDALVQRHIPTEAQGRAFARFETRFQLSWVFGALIPVVFSLPLPSGDIVIATLSGVSGLSYLASRRALRHR